MKSVLLAIAILIPATLSAASQDPNDSPLASVYSKKTAFQTFMEKHPGSHELVGQRGAKQVRFIRPDGKRSALFGRSLTYKDPITAAWNLLAPVLSTTKNGWVMTGSFVDLYIRKKGQGHDVVVQLTDPASKKPASFTLSLPALTWQKQMDFGFSQQGLTWRLRVIDGGLALRAPVSARRGSTTYSFGYQSFWKLAQTSAGGLTDGGNLTLTRAVMLGSDHKRYSCAAWSVVKNTITFTCDDSKLPDAAIPYVIDPSASFNPPSDEYITYAWDNSTSTASCNDDMPIYGDSRDPYNRSSLSLSWDISSLGSPTVYSSSWSYSDEDFGESSHANCSMNQGGVNIAGTTASSGLSMDCSDDGQYNGWGNDDYIACSGTLDVDYFGSDPFLTFEDLGGPQIVAGTVHYMNVYSNLNWTVTSSAWLHVSQSSGSGIGQISYWADWNYGDWRTGAITLSGPGVSPVSDVVYQYPSNSPPSYTLSVPSPIQTVPIGGSGSYMVNVTDYYGSQLVWFNVYDLPDGATASWNNMIGSGANPVTINAGTAAPGLYSLTLYSANGYGEYVYTPLTLNVDPPNPGSITVTPLKLVSSEANGAGRFEPSSATSGTGSWATTWFDLPNIAAYASTWNGSSWNPPYLLGGGTHSFADVYLAWDPVHGNGRFVFVAIDTDNLSVYYGYSNGSAWTTVSAPAFAASSNVHWDRPSIGVDINGRIIIGAPKFMFNEETLNFEDAGFFAVVDNTTLDPYGNGIDSNGNSTFPTPTPVYDCPGALSRVVAAGTKFEAFIPELTGNFNQMTGLFRMESIDGINWSGPNNIMDFPQNPPLLQSVAAVYPPSDSPSQYPSTTPLPIFYAAYPDAQGYANGQWAVTWPIAHTFENICGSGINNTFNNIMIATSDRGCGLVNSDTDNQFLQGTAVSGDTSAGQYWVSYYTFNSQGCGVLQLPLLVQAVFFLPTYDALGADISNGVNPASWPVVTGARCSSGPCFGAGDYNGIAANPLEMASVPIVKEAAPNPSYQQNEVWQAFAQDPAGAHNVGNFQPNFVPFPMGSNLSNSLKHDPNLKPLPNHRASTIYLLKVEKGKQVPGSDSVHPSVKPYPVFH